MTRDDFAEIARQLQEAAVELQETLNHQLRPTLVRHIRLLLLEADRILDEAPVEPPSQLT
jgi:hypothetical protein